MFWGRTLFYHRIFHMCLIIIISFITLGSISAKINESFSEKKETTLNINSGIIGGNDTLEQIGTIETAILLEDETLPFPVFFHTVKKGDSLEEIADDYGFGDINSIVWANNLNPNSPEILPGETLKIPPMKGVLKEAGKNDTAKSIIKGIGNVNIFDVLEINNLKSKSEPIASGRMIFIPNGNIKPIYQSTLSNIINKIEVNIEDGYFQNPLVDPTCNGYKISRGWKPHHTGVDMTKREGCWISSIGEGIIRKMGICGGGLGYCVIVEHPNKVVSLYAHGNGQFPKDLQEGSFVNKGERIMYMGNSGNSFGTHLHFSITTNEYNIIQDYYYRIDPKGIVPY